MLPEIRVKPRLPRMITKSIKEVFGLIVLFIIGSILLLQLPTQQPAPYEDIYKYLSSTGQLYQDVTIAKEKNLEKVYVEEITDGDTIKVIRADGSKAIIRYIGIDTPEIKHREGEINEKYGQEATSVNAWLVNNKEVYLQKDAAETDKYGRLLRYVYLEDGTMVNYVLIRLGYATIMTIPPNVAFQQQFYAAQELAKAEGRNLFAPTE